MVVAWVPHASTGFPGTLANVPPDSVETDGLVANRLRFAQVANQTSIAPTTPNVVLIEHVDAVKALSPTEPCASMSMNAKGNLTFVDLLLLVPTLKEATSVDVSLP